MRIQILDSANQDLLDGYWFYEKQAEGLGVYFLETLFSDIDSLRVYAGIHSLYLKKYHRLLSKRFPFAVYYQVENDIVSIFAVLDCRRNPAWIKNRFK
jgi:hypothetical protein